MTTSCAETTRIDAVMEQMHTTGTARGDEGVDVDISAYAISSRCARLLDDAAHAAGAATSIEIGLGSGLATLAIGRGRLRAGPIEPGSMHVIDPHQRHFRNIGLHAGERAGLSAAITFHGDPSHAALPRLLEAGTRAQLAFVDGMHHLEHVVMDLFYLDLMLDRGGVIAVHDMWMPALQHAVSYWVANRAYEPVTVVEDGRLVDDPCESDHRGCGDPAHRPPFFSRRIEPFVDCHTLLLRKQDDDHRNWDAFTDYIP